MSKKHDEPSAFDSKYDEVPVYSAPEPAPDQSEQPDAVRGLELEHEALHRGVDAIDARVGALEVAFVELHTAVSELQPGVETLTARATSNEKVWDSLCGNVEALTGLVAKLQADVDALRAQSAGRARARDQLGI